MTAKQKATLKARLAQGTILTVAVLPHEAHARERDADFATMRRPDADR